MAEPMVRLSGVSKAYGTVRAVSGLDLTVPAGAVYGLLGPNGSGKTTTIRMIMNILLPDEGQIEIQGRPADAKSKDAIGYLPEERGLYTKMKVGDVLDFFAELKGVPKAEAARRVDRWLERVELTAWKDHKINELSKGMQQKIQFIVSVLGDPPILILDEPSSGLDPVNANLLREILLELRAAGKTILFSTHRMEEAERLCDHICLIHRGVKLLDGELGAIRAAAGKSAVRIEFRGDGAVVRGAPGVAGADDYGNYAEARLAPGADPAALLRYLTGKLDVTGFHLQEPTLNQIFLEQVGGREAAQPALAAAGTASQSAMQ
ncbi:MAG: ABC transporter ATP-binding protein [Terriglobales bacterium]